MSWIAAGIAGGSALLKLGTGLIQNHSANSIENQMQYPTAPIQSEYTQNLNQAQNIAQTGIPAPAYNNQLNSIQRSQAGGLAALSRSANPGANVASIVRQGDDATNQLNSQDAMMRNQNLMGLLNARLQLAQQKDKAWDWNYQQRYLSNLAKANQIRGAANSNINGAFGDTTGTATKLGQLNAFGGTGQGTQSYPYTGVPGGFVDSSAGLGSDVAGLT